MLHNLQQIFAWALPRICVCCGFNSNDLYLDLCLTCKEQLPWLAECCYQCGIPILKLSESIICEQCQQCVPPYNRTCALFTYKPPITKLIGSLKFGRQLFPGALFGSLMVEAITKHWYKQESLPQVIIPVPLHERRYRQRGYNQVVEICAPIANVLGIPLDSKWCSRIKYTMAQAKLKKTLRQRNLVDAFRVDVMHKYKYVALVDDIVTTGSTIKAVSLVLQDAGVENIDVWCVARA